MSLEVFEAIGTQWRVGAGGPTGLDYNVFPEIWRRHKVPICDRDQVFADIQVMERAALDVMRKER